MNGKTQYVIVESKAYGDTKPASPSERGIRRVTKKTGRQMSDKWIEARLDKMNLTSQEKADLMAGLKPPGAAGVSVKRIYARTDAAGTSYFEINRDGVNEAKIGNRWHPKK